MYEQFMQKLNNEPAKSVVTLNIADNMVLNPSLLWERLSDLDKISDQELYTLLSRYYDTILDQIFVSKDARFIDLFTNSRFITIINQVFYTVNLSDSQTRMINKMAYDYLVLKNDKDEYIQDLLMVMAKTVNRTTIPKLCALNIPESVASLLTLARFSSSKERINVKRLNHILMSQPEESINEQLVVDIFLALFDHLLPLFEGVMLDVVSAQNMSSSEAEIYGLITLAILDLMNELPIADIMRGLESFSNTKRILYPDHNTRINLESCSPHDYPRLLTAIDNLKAEDTYMPRF